MSSPSLAELLGTLSRSLLADLSVSPGAVLRLRPLPDGRLLLRFRAEQAERWDRAELRRALGALEAVETRESEGFVELLLDPGPRRADFQTPEVLLSLRAAAAAHPAVAFRVELPPRSRQQPFPPESEA